MSAGAPESVVVPQLKLPLRVTLLFNDKIKKNTGVHARILAPQDVELIQYRNLEKKHDVFDPSTDVVLFPSQDAVTFEELPPQQLLALKRVVLIDTPWQFAKKKVLGDARVMGLTRIKLGKVKKHSSYWRYHLEGADCLSTIECLVQALNEFSDAVALAGFTSNANTLSLHGSISSVQSRDCSDTKPVSFQRSSSERPGLHSSVSTKANEKMSTSTNTESTTTQHFDDLLFFFRLIAQRITQSRPTDSHNANLPTTVAGKQQLARIKAQNARAGSALQKFTNATLRYRAVLLTRESLQQTSHRGSFKVDELEDDTVPTKKIRKCPVESSSPQSTSSMSPVAPVANLDDGAAYFLAYSVSNKSLSVFRVADKQCNLASLTDSEFWARIDARNNSDHAKLESRPDALSIQCLIREHHFHLSDAAQSAAAPIELDRLREVRSRVQRCFAVLVVCVSCRNFCNFGHGQKQATKGTRRHRGTPVPLLRPRHIQVSFQGVILNACSIVVSLSIHSRRDSGISGRNSTASLQHHQYRSAC